MTTQESLIDDQLAGALKRLEPAAFRPFTRRMDACIRALNMGAGVPDEIAPILEASVLQSGFPVLLWIQAGELAAAPRLLNHIWHDQMRAFGLDFGSSEISEPPPGMPDVSALGSQASESYAMFNDAVIEQLRDKGMHQRGNASIGRLMGVLDLSFDDLGQILGVAGETVRRWHRGRVNIPQDQTAKLDLLDAGLRRLEGLFAHDRIASVIRRPAKLFGGSTALAEIRRGNLAEVANKYDAVLHYQL